MGKNNGFCKTTQSDEIVCTLSLFSFRFSIHLLRADILLDSVLGSGETKMNKTQCMTLWSPLSVV